MGKKITQYWDKGLQLVYGCTPVSPACDHCWSLSMERRFRKNAPGNIRENPKALQRVYTTKKPTVFAIWNDLFHADVSDWLKGQLWSVMCSNVRHTFLICTKRPESILPWFRYHAVYEGKPNMWFGTTVETQEYVKRLEYLNILPVAHRWVSVEPMLGAVNLDLGKNKLNWVVCGPENGPGKRECKYEWVENLYLQCVSAGVPFFWKGDDDKFPRQYPKELQKLERSPR